MRLKYYLRGLGTGIIFTSIILAIIYSYRTTDAKIIERAKELGMITGEVSGESELDNTTPFEEEESGEEMSSFANGQEDITSESETSAEAQEETSESNGNTENNEEVLFRITAGMTAEAIAKGLEEAGVIENSSDFKNFLIDGGYTYSLVVGDFNLIKGSTYQEIVDVITE